MRESFNIKDCPTILCVFDFKVVTLWQVTHIFSQMSKFDSSHEFVEAHPVIFMLNELLFEHTSIELIFEKLQKLGELAMMQLLSQLVS